MIYTVTGSPANIQAIIARAGCGVDLEPEPMTMPSRVSEHPAAASSLVIEHFTGLLALETDCSDVETAQREGAVDFVLLDVRGPQLFRRSHVPGALNLPHGKMTAQRMAEWPADTLFVVYCAGPHCNGADKAALRLAQLGRRVKMMIGGMTGWADEGFAFDSEEA